MLWTLWMFILVLLVAFAVVLLLAGLFGSFFGSGRSRTYGVILALVGLVMVVSMAYMCSNSIEPFNFDISAWELLKDGIIYLIGILIGALVAAGIFLVAVLRS